VLSLLVAFVLGIGFDLAGGFLIAGGSLLERPGAEADRASAIDESLSRGWGARSERLPLAA
jgi:hypothetical protein